jgi:glutamine synthetase
MNDSGRIERENMGFNELDAWLNGRSVTEIECLVPDITGTPRGKILPRAKFREERGMRLPELVLGMTVTGEVPNDEAFRADRTLGDRPDCGGDSRLFHLR